MSAGIGALGSLGVATETTPLVAVSPTITIPINSESFKADRTAIPSSSIVGDSMVQAVAAGVSVCEGGFNMEVEGSVAGQAIWLWSGNNGYTHAAITGFATVAPTGITAATGGTLANGAYKYAASSVYTRINDSVNIIFPSTATSLAVTAAGSGISINTITFTAPGAVTGYTAIGTIIWRTIAAGSVLGFLAYQSGSGTSFADDGTFDPVANFSTVPYTASLYGHTMVGSPPVSGDRLTPFTVTVNHDNDLSQQFITCRMDSMKLGVSGLDDKLMGDFTAKGAAAGTLANVSPSFVPLEPMIGWHCVIQINGAADQTLESFEINCSNGVQVVPGMRGVPFNRDTISGMRKISGQMTRQFATTAVWSQMLAGLDFSLYFTSYGQCIANPTLSGVTSTMAHCAITAIPFQYYIQITLPRCKLNKAGGNITSPDRIIETVAFDAFKDPVTATDMKIVIQNTTISYT